MSEMSFETFKGENMKSVNKVTSYQVIVDCEECEFKTDYITHLDVASSIAKVLKDKFKDGVYLEERTTIVDTETSSSSI